MPDPLTPDASTAAPVRGGRWSVLAVVALVVVTLGLGWVLMKPADGGSSAVQVAGAVAAPRVGDAAPDFTATAIDGSTVKLSELRGKPVWVVFMATWCAECRVEAPEIQATYEERPDLHVVAVYLGEDATDVTPYATRLGLRFGQVPDPDSAVAAAYGVRAIPAHYFLDADGVVRDILVGAVGEDRISQSVAKAQ